MKKCDLTGTGTGIAQNCQSRYRESRSFTEKHIIFVQIILGLYYVKQEAKQAIKNNSICERHIHLGLIIRVPRKQSVVDYKHTFIEI